MIPNLIKQMQQQDQPQQPLIQYNNNKINEININNQKSSQTNDNNKSPLQSLLIETIKKKNDLLSQLQELTKQVRSLIFLFFSFLLFNFHLKNSNRSIN